MRDSVCCVYACCATHSTVLYCTVLYCTRLYSTVLYCTVLCCTALYCTELYSFVLYCTVLFCTVLRCTALCFFLDSCVSGVHIIIIIIIISHCYYYYLLQNTRTHIYTQEHMVEEFQEEGVLRAEDAEGLLREVRHGARALETDWLTRLRGGDTLVSLVSTSLVRQKTEKQSPRKRRLSLSDLKMVPGVSLQDLAAKNVMSSSGPSDRMDLPQLLPV